MDKNYKALIGICLLAVVMFCVFLPCVQGQFLALDDYEVFLNNPAVAQFSFNSLKIIFSQNIHNVYIPLTTLSFAIEHYWAGFNPFVFHLDNILLHTANVILVFLLAARLGLSGRAALFAALIFGIHPMRAESVAWTAERKDVLYAFFYLLALHQYCSYLDKNSKKAYIWTLFLGICSMLAKPMALSLPLVLFILDWFKGRRLDGKACLVKVPFLLYVIFLAAISYVLNGGAAIKPGEAVLIWLWSFSFYIYKFIFPYHVSPYYSLPQPIEISHWPYLASVLFFLLVLGVVIWARKNRLLMFAFVFWFASIFFLLRFEFNSGFSVVSDRYMYLPSLGFCLLFGAWLDRRCVAVGTGIVVAAIVVLFGIKTQQQCRIWHDSLTLFDQIVRDHPQSPLGYTRRGFIYYSEGQYKQAITDCSRAIELDPQSFLLYDLRGESYLALGLKTQATEDFYKTIQLCLLKQRSLCATPIARENLFAIPVLTVISAQTAADWLADSFNDIDDQNYGSALKKVLRAKESGIPVVPCFIERLHAAAK